MCLISSSIIYRPYNFGVQDLASMEIEECPDSRGPSPTPTPEREAEASRFLLQHTDLIPPKLAEIMTASQRANVLGVLLRY